MTEDEKREALVEEFGYQAHQALMNGGKFDADFIDGLVEALPADSPLFETYQKNLVLRLRAAQENNERSLKQAEDAKVVLAERLAKLPDVREEQPSSK